MPVIGLRAGRRHNRTKERSAPAHRPLPRAAAIAGPLVFLIAFLAPSIARGTLPYPRLLTTLWSSPEPQDFANASKFDAVEFFWTDIVTVPGYPDSVRAMKQRNPNLKVIGVIWCDVHCTNWDPREIVMWRWSQQMAANDYWWYLRDTDGDYFKTPAEFSCAEGFMNWTRPDMAEAFAQYVHEEMFLAYPGVFDGVHFDALVGGISWIQERLWTEGGIDSIDSNRDGVADRPDSLNARWARGVNAFCQRMRSLAGSNSILIVNGGVPSASFQHMNGRFHEGFPGAIGGQAPDWHRSMLDPQIGYLRETALYNGLPQQMFPLQGLSFYPYDCDPNRVSTTTKPFDPICCMNMVRLTVASTLLGDGYACFTGFARAPAGGGGDAVAYHSTWWFPLYDSLRVNLGTPLGPAYDSTTAFAGQKQYKRHYTNGTVRITHTQGAPLPASSSIDLRPKAVFRESPAVAPWIVGTPKTIRFRGWDPMTGTGFIQVRLLLSRNGGSSYPETLAVKNAADSVATFVIPGPVSSNCRLRIEAKDLTGYKGWNNSDAFSILSSSTASGFAEVFPDSIPVGRGVQATLHALVASAPPAGIAEITLKRPSALSMWSPGIVTVNGGPFIGSATSAGDSIRVRPTTPWSAGTRVQIRMTVAASTVADPDGSPVVARLVTAGSPVQRVAALPGDADGIPGNRESLTIFVPPGPALRVVVMPGTASVGAGGRRFFYASGRDQYQNAVPVAATWSVLGRIGTITQGGIFTAGSLGQGGVVARVAAKRDTAEVTVVPGPPKRLEVEPDSLVFLKNTEAQFTATLFDTMGNVVQGAVTWSKTGPATLTGPGRLFGAATGVGFITARSGVLADSNWYRVRSSGDDTDHQPVGTQPAAVPIVGLAVWPQPIAGGATAQIAFTLPPGASQAPVADLEVDVYDTQGRLVTTLSPAGALAAGSTVTLSWDARDGSGRAVASGVYVLRASAPSVGLRLERKILVVR